MQANNKRPIEVYNYLYRRDFSPETLSTVFPEGLLEEVNKHGGFWVAGGALTALASRADINDLDCYFPSKEALLAFIEYLDVESYVYISFVSGKSITLNMEGRTVQCIFYDYYDSSRRHLG